MKKQNDYGVLMNHLIGSKTQGTTLVKLVTGISPNTLTKGRKELLSNDPHVLSKRIRRKGAGRTQLINKIPHLVRLAFKMFYILCQNNPFRIFNAKKG